MSIIVDLHIHSKYSRAVSPKMNLLEIARWATIKGINVVGTGDWTHPRWFQEIITNLKETQPGSGLYSLKKSKVNFILTVEISSIYSQGGKIRRVHNLILSPSITTCKKIINTLEKRGAKLASDGRPIVGLSSKEILKIILDVDERAMLIPCHIWTPWFSLFGSKSGFDSIKECYGEMDKYIYGIETGLSSDPVMNWQIPELHTRSILSSSDAHSGAKLGREATVFVPKILHSPFSILNLTYDDICDAIKQKPNSHLKIDHTIEFFPEEGKYHWSGHRACDICYNPKQIKKMGTICPVCHKPLTIGVENRVVDLSKKIIDYKKLHYIKNNVGVTFVYDENKKRQPFVSIVPLLEILKEVKSGSPTKAQTEYDKLISKNLTEFYILLEASYEELEKIGGKKLHDAIKIVRDRKAIINPGYDGVFGRVTIFNEK